MRSIRQILVAIRDPQARSQPGLQKAAQLASRLGARLELFHALTWPIYAVSEEGFNGVQESGEKFALRHLQRLADRLSGRGRTRPARVSVAVRWDSPAYEAVIRRARDIKANLIVAERHRGTHAFPLLLHFNDWELLRGSPIPVLLVKRGGRYDHPVVLAAVDPTHSLDKPAALDKAILDTSSVITAALRGRLHTVHAYVALIGGEQPTRPLDAETAAILNRRQLTELRRRYERLLDGHRIPAERRHLLNLPPADAIQAVADRTRAGIVALGAISRSRWQRLLIGNTAETLLDPLHCDLLVVKPPRFKARVSRRPTGPQYLPALGIGIMP